MYGFGNGFGGFVGFLSAIAQIIGGLIITAVLVGVTILLVRFLLVGTRAAQLYLDRHEPRRPDPDADRYRPQAPTPAPAPASAPTPASPATVALVANCAGGITSQSASISIPVN